MPRFNLFLLLVVTVAVALTVASEQSVNAITGVAVNSFEIAPASSVSKIDVENVNVDLAAKKANKANKAKKAVKSKKGNSSSSSSSSSAPSSATSTTLAPSSATSTTLAPSEAYSCNSWTVKIPPPGISPPTQAFTVCYRTSNNKAFGVYASDDNGGWDTNTNLIAPDNVALDCKMVASYYTNDNNNPDSFTPDNAYPPSTIVSGNSVFGIGWKYTVLGTLYNFGLFEVGGSPSSLFCTAIDNISSYTATDNGVVSLALANV